MANHGWLPRSGKNIDLAALRFAVTGAYNYAPTTFDSAFEQAVSFNLTTTGNSSNFHLADLAKHDAIEFDGSLSRNDFYFGDNLHYDPAIWATMAKRLRLYETGDSEMDKYVTVETAAKARAARVQDAMKVNPTFNASANALSGSPGTTALYLVTLWDAKVGAAPKAWIRAFFGRFCTCCSLLRHHCDATMLTIGQRRSASRILRGSNCLKCKGPVQPSVTCLKGFWQ
jgi:hypothetical protein